MKKNSSKNRGRLSKGQVRKVCEKVLRMLNWQDRPVLEEKAKLNIELRNGIQVSLLLGRQQNTAHISYAGEPLPAMILMDRHNLSNILPLSTTKKPLMAELQWLFVHLAGSSTSFDRVLALKGQDASRWSAVFIRNEPHTGLSRTFAY